MGADDASFTLYLIISKEGEISRHIPKRSAVICEPEATSIHVVRARVFDAEIHLGSPWSASAGEITDHSAIGVLCRACQHARRCRYT